MREESTIFKKVKEISFKKGIRTMTNPVGRSSRIRVCLVPVDYELNIKAFGAPVGVEGKFCEYTILIL